MPWGEQAVSTRNGCDRPFVWSITYIHALCFIAFPKSRPTIYARSANAHSLKQRCLSSHKHFVPSMFAKHELLIRQIIPIEALRTQHVCKARTHLQMAATAFLASTHSARNGKHKMSPFSTLQLLRAMGISTAKHTPLETLGYLMPLRSNPASEKDKISNSMLEQLF